MGVQTRDDIFRGVTTSLCSACAAPVAARIVQRNGAVYLSKNCPEHGRHDEILEEDAAWFLKREEYRTPGTPSRVETQTRRGCPYDCGLCPDHAQHTCIGLIEITNRCDAACPVCYARAGAGGFLSLDVIARMLDAYQEAEGGKAEILQVSGGEPTMHPRVLDVIRLARDKGIRYVMLNTNGRRLAEEPAFARALAEFSGGFEVYLQFDGLDAAASRRLRGRDCTPTHQRALEYLAAAGVPATLVATVEAGVNDAEIGRIVEFGLNAPGVRGINFQPLAYFGAAEGRPPEGRITLSGVLKRIERQTGGQLRMDDFVPLPCDPNRVSISYLYRQKGRFVPAMRHVDVRASLPVAGNTLTFFPQDALARAAREACGGSACSCLNFAKDLIPLAPLAGRAALARNRAAFTTENLFRVTVTSFLDRYNFDLHSMQMECVHVLTPDGRRIPFSAYNLHHRSNAHACPDIADALERR